MQRVQVVGVLRPNELGIAAFAADGRDYAEIVVLAAGLHDADRRPRVEELLHRAVHNPVVLLLATAHESWFSLAHKRPAPATAAGVMIDEVETAPVAPPSATTEDFLRSLSLRLQPAAQMFVLYEGWIDCVLAAQAAVLTGIYAVIAGTARRTALAEYQRLEHSLDGLRAEARRTVQVARRVELNLAIKQLEAEQRTCIELLSRTTTT